MQVKRLGLVLAVLGILPYALLRSWLTFEEPLNWKALEYPVSLRTGQITSPVFTTKRSAGYLILLEFDRNIEPRRMDCLLGIGRPYENCSDIPESVDVSWTLTTDEHPNGAGTSESSHWTQYNESISRVIGSFDAKKGQNHIVQLNIRRDGRDLDSAKPRLVVLGYYQYLEDADLLQQLTFFLAVFVGGGGLLLFAMPLVVRRITSGRHSQPQSREDKVS